MAIAPVKERSLFYENFLSLLTLTMLGSGLVTRTEGTGTVKALFVHDGDEESGSREAVKLQSQKYQTLPLENSWKFLNG